MQIAVFTMFRNEGSILNSFLDQLDEFFDVKILVDHESSDNSADIVRKRSSAQKEGAPYELYSLKAAGYPQSRLATFLARRLFSRSAIDWLFFLDCDEFLPFGNKSELIHALSNLQNNDVVTLNWRNIVAADLNGKDIFAGSFETLKKASPYRKIAVSRNVFLRDPNFIVEQGYHGVRLEYPNIRTAELSEVGLIHIPVQSKFRFAAKIRASANRVMNETAFKIRGDGFHWVGYHRQLEAEGISNFDFRSAALAYPSEASESQGEPVVFDFPFPYILAPYHEDFSEIVTELYSDNQRTRTADESFVLYDGRGLVLEGSPRGVPSLREADENTTIGLGEINDNQEFYSDLIEPLLSLPLKMPQSAWSGHIPFLFTLFRLLRPKIYVELGVHFGASLIAAATASTTYQIPMRLFGVDSWEGDTHAGMYSGDLILKDLTSFVSAHFKNVDLLRSYFDDAALRFQPRSIDVLHIDGLHTYDAVKSDFLTWLPKMSPTGVVLFHDIGVHERGFGVNRFWAELQRKFVTLEFFHSFGLGVSSWIPLLRQLLPLFASRKTNGFSRSISLWFRISADFFQVRMQALDQNRVVAEGASQSQAPSGQEADCEYEREKEREFLQAEVLALKSQLQVSKLGVLARIARRIRG